MRKLFEAIFSGKQKLQQEWNCLEAWTADVRFLVSGYTHPWGCEGTEVGATENTMGSGDTNTDTIIANCAATNNAATVAREARGGETDWYLPTSVEAIEMNSQKAIIPDFDPAARGYWTSLEEDADNAYFLSGGATAATLKSNVAYVRPIRKCLGDYAVGDVGPGGGIIFYVQPAVPTHKISIYDVDLAEDDSSQDIIVEAPGYTVNWNAGVSDVVTGGIIESSAEFTIRNIDGVLDTFIEDLNTSPEGKFVVDIQKKTVLSEEWESFWKGVMMPDFSSRQDIPNEPISFQATDGLALLDAIELTSEDSELMLVTAIKGLRQIPTVGLFDVLSELRFLWAKTEWYSEDLVSGTEPLYQIGLFGKSLWVKKEVSEGYSGELKTEIIGLTYKEVLQHLCERFNCILVMQQGAWYLFQRDLLLEDTIEFQTFRAYPTSGDNYTTNPSSTTIASYKEIDQSERYRSEGEFFNLPGLKSVKAIYGGGNLSDGNDSLIPSGFILGQTYTTMPLQSGTDRQLNLRISFLENYVIDWVGATPPDVYFSASILYKITVRCGSYYLNVFTGAWTLDSSVADFTFRSQTRLHHNTAAGVTAEDIPEFIDQVSFYKNLLTQDLPTDSAVTFKMERDSVLIHDGEGSFTVDVDDNFNFTPDLENHFLLYIVDDEGPQAYAEFTANNPTSGFQLEHDMGESLFGTARVIMNRVIGANNGGGELWEVGYATTKTLNFNELLVREVIKKQNKALMCFSGTILERNEDFMHLFQAIEFDVDGETYRFLFNNVSYNAMRETWNGDWFELYNDSVSSISPATEVDNYNISRVPAIPRPDGQIYDSSWGRIFDVNTGDIDVTQGGESDGDVITNTIELLRQEDTPDAPEADRVIIHPDVNGILKQTDSFGVTKIVGADSSKIIPSPDVEILDGYLYNWFVTQEASLISEDGITEGWAVPTEGNFTTLVNYLITKGYNFDDVNTGNKIGKAVCTDSGWDVSTVTGAVGNTDYPAKINETLLSVRPTGIRDTLGAFDYEGEYAYFWTTTSYLSRNGIVYLCYFDGVDFSSNDVSQQCGLTIRLFRTATAPEIAFGDGHIVENAYIGNDGKVYNGVVLGAQVWITQNLTETLYNTGVEIPECLDGDVWAELTVPARCSYDNDIIKSFTESDEIIFADDKLLSSKSIKYKVKQVSADYEMTSFDNEIEITANSPTITTLDVSDYEGKEITITNIGTGIGTITGDVLGGDFSLYQYESLTLRSNGTNWVVK